MIPASNLLLIAAGLVAFIAVLILLNAFLAARWAQRAAYYSVRRDAQRSANRRLSLSVSAFALAVFFFVMSFFVPREAAQPPPTAPTPARVVGAVARLSPIPSASAPLESPIQQLSPTATVKATQIPEPTSSLISPLPTSTPTPAPESPSPSALPTQVPPNKRLVLNVVASGIDAKGAPIDAGTEFTPGVKSIYVFFDYTDVPPNALLRHTWFHNGGSVFFRSKPLTQNGSGMDYISWSPAGGFRPGLYEVRIVLGGVPQFVANFEVK